MADNPVRTIVSVAMMPTTIMMAPAFQVLNYGYAFMNYGAHGFGVAFGMDLEQASLAVGIFGVGKGIGYVAGSVAGGNIIFGSSVKSAKKISNQMASRGWTERSVRRTVNNPYTTRVSVNHATGNRATAFFNSDGSHVIIDNRTRAVVQVSDRFDPAWAPDRNIINPFIPRR